jgi:hypothetical protein
MTHSYAGNYIAKECDVHPREWIPVVLDGPAPCESAGIALRVEGSLVQNLAKCQASGFSAFAQPFQYWRVGLPKGFASRQSPTEVNELDEKMSNEGDVRFWPNIALKRICRKKFY